MKTIIKYILLAAVVGIFVSAECAEAKKHTVPYSVLFPKLDGNIDSDPAWKSVPWNEGGFFIHRKEAVPKKATRFKACYTTDALYVGIECEEPDLDKLKKVYNFDEFWIYDTVEVFLFPARREMLQFIANYQSMQYDVFSGAVSKRAKYQTGWKAFGIKNKTTWTVEFCIPFWLIGKIPAGKNFTIPVNICRNSTTVPERSTWNLQMGGFKEVKGFGRFVFVQPPTRPRRD